MPIVLRVQLSVMMFLQYFVFGTWLAVLPIHLESKGVGLSAGQTGWIMSVYGFGAILGPFILGQLADRFMATERVMAIAHILGGFLLIGAAYVTDFWLIFGLLFLYCNLYMPTMGLSNSLTFRAAGEGNQDAFPAIRLWGTIGWIAAGWFFTFYRTNPEVLKPLFDIVGEPGTRDCLRVAGVASFIYGLYCFSLPHTPPVAAKKSDDSTKSTNPIIESLELMKFPSFAVVVVVAGLIGIMLAFYFACEGLFLKDIGIPEEQIGFYMSFGQIAEIVCMALVPFAVRKMGIKTTMIIGASAWAVRFGLSILGQPQWLMIATICLHGFAFGFFFVVAQMYVDKAAGPDIKATAQNFLIFVIYGIGTIVGSVGTGPVREYFENKWPGIWAGPTILTVICIIAFAILFKEEQIRKPVTTSETPEIA